MPPLLDKEPIPERVAAFEAILCRGLDAFVGPFLDLVPENQVDHLCACIGVLHAATLLDAIRGGAEFADEHAYNAAAAAQLTHVLATDKRQTGAAFADFLNNVEPTVEPSVLDSRWPRAHWRLCRFMDLVARVLRANRRIAAEEDVQVLVQALAEALILCAGSAFAEFLGDGQSRFEQKQIASMVAALAAQARQEYRRARQRATSPEPPPTA